ncbi:MULTISPECIES: potassium channel family protein [Microbacterium]|uniref:Two pore domain potassium channel family protein n=1 Tax=Microbacterium wangchenii TaxID=2541726 RepID=A0ABX5SYQ9_9MICO|nr:MULTISPECIES: potassium channel family protein [Microbacterium]MCK6066103.1 potassium channel family protein [Microbacterium sp. EYE_512]QBR90385.1 two pore domain potassium channel family protein [Microbacterium wangchenii]TFV84809.1 two pore domain potassium channel family protein [Microbacterium sp. dk485]TXK11599.1 potassium channel family protein [Microbacterium wangchenii]
MAEGDKRATAHRRHRHGRGETARTRRWEAATYWPLTVIAFLFLVAYTFQVIGDLQGAWRVATLTVIRLAWVVFAVDYLVRLILSSPRPRWFRTHLFDLAVVLIPALRPVRLLGALTRITSFTRTAGSSLRAKLLIYGTGAALLLIWQTALVVLEAERRAPGASIRSFGDALWWAFCTVTTVGYGDYVPVTAAGRTFAVLLMVGGVVLVGLIVASFSSWVVERATRGHAEQQPATRADVDRIIAALNARPGDTPPHPR